MASPTFETLLDLQEQDLALDRLAYRTRELAERRALASIEQGLADLERRVAEAESQRKELVSAQEELDRQVEATSARIAAIDARLRSPGSGSFRDQQAMSKEMESLAGQRRAVEDRELEIMEHLEPVDAVLAALYHELATATAAREAARAALSAAEALLVAERLEVEGRRGPLLAAVPGDLLANYQRLREKLGGIGAARVVDGSCSGCHLRLPASERERLAYADPGSLMYCEQCGRILVP